MKIVLKDRTSGRFLGEGYEWTTRAQEALAFSSSDAALIASEEHGLAEADLVFRFERQGYSITVPLRPAAGCNIKHRPPAADIFCKADRPV
jgi:hypothetical protein